MSLHTVGTCLQMAKVIHGSHSVVFPINIASIMAGPAERSQEVPRKHPCDTAALQSPIPPFLGHSKAVLRPKGICRRGVQVVGREV